MSRPILCVGEVLWDALPAGLFLGGAPTNVARHLHRLRQPIALVSRVGDDVLGHEALRRLDADGLDTRSVQIDDALPTGFVSVTLRPDGEPSYEIVEPAAWDAIDLSEDLAAQAADAPAVVFGSLAQRHDTSRKTVQTLAATSDFAVLDVNLRPPFVDPDIVRASLRIADCVKLNTDELRELSGWFAWPDAPRAAAEALAAAFDCRTVCVTRGERGAALWRDGRWMEHSGHPAAESSAVGAGDAFLAAFLASVLAGHNDEVALDLACRLGAYVASQPGAVPNYDVARLGRIASFLG